MMTSSRYEPVLRSETVLSASIDELWPTRDKIEACTVYLENRGYNVIISYLIVYGMNPRTDHS